MIISASRRTDIPAYHAEWFMQCIREGRCRVPNPVNPRQVSEVDLSVSAVDAIVFWTRDASPMLPHLPELDRLGYHYVFLVTLLNYPTPLDDSGEQLENRISMFHRLAERLGPTRVAWRYDPILFSNRTPPEYHAEAFDAIAQQLEGCTHRVIVSILDRYRKLEAPLGKLGDKGIELNTPPVEERIELGRSMLASSQACGMRIQSCAEDDAPLRQACIPRGGCIDDRWLEECFGGNMPHRPDSGQRKACRCTVSRDIGCYNTCPRVCVYCYASRHD